MEINPMKVGARIYRLRKIQGLTQNQLGDRLHISFQAVSKWERGEALPDVALLPSLAEALDTTIDNILLRDNPAKGPGEFTRTVTIAQLREVVECVERMGQLLGKGSFFYTGAVGGIDLKMNIEFEKYMAEPYTREAMTAEAACQAIMDGAYIDPKDIEASFQFPHWTENVREFARKYGI